MNKKTQSETLRTINQERKNKKDAIIFGAMALALLIINVVLFTILL
ncbi:hypothetical protein HGB13_00135 [bacterium]|nr:hypothetical protein [bacterium]